MGIFMIYAYKRKASIASVIAISSIAIFCTQWPASEFDSVRAIFFTIFLASFSYGLLQYVKAKGHHPAWLLILVVSGGLGLYVLLRLKDRHKESGVRQLKRVCFPYK